ncbi:hypothetical protein LCGC14_0691990 [marine sediment metagenome]|uniref:Ribbon-helix-helix protein CopG domain-containing protein n=1 Tax=marine sediment metagenome TaxID=412755 RepID=A0A0F9QQ08_9ZZZZ
MPNVSSKSRIISFRLSNEALDKIEKALKSPANQNTSVSDYCKQVVERHAFRHDKRRFKTEV